MSVGLQKMEELLHGDSNVIHFASLVIVIVSNATRKP